MYVFRWSPCGFDSAPWEPLLLMPIGDIQYAGPESPTDIERLARHVQWGVDNGAYFFGMGDYIDLASPSNRRAIAAARLYDSTRIAFETAAKLWLGELYEALAPSAGRWIGLLPGHHLYRFEDGGNTDVMLAQKLGCAFLCDNVGLEPNMAHFTIAFSDGMRSAVVKIWAHHGSGWGATVSSALLRLEREAEGWEADLYLMGHQSKEGILPKRDRIDITVSGEPREFSRKPLLVATGGFMRGHQQGRSSYAEHAGMTPLSVGAPIVWLKPERVRSRVLGVDTVRVAVEATIRGGQ